MTGLNNLVLFLIGVVVTIPAATVVIALVFAAGIDDRAEKKAAEHHRNESSV